MQDDTAAEEVKGMDRVREMLVVSERSHRVTCSNPDDPSRRTLYSDTVDLARALETVEGIVTSAEERYGPAGAALGEEIMQAIARAVELDESVRFVPGRGQRF
ncbi:hypothetical protein [Arthrobacter caoxuetaonis]|uniref:Uncharacterized protein n=1 Tax=Arthrobacter caoxuetaonis TaxID=2886935 RepID=A0A9X1SED7_9MICC|nr:hypothetical protein [Arthrobacter caoxuetaonis]MCC3299742.1 hypothetical protein [Arthrobacter caoxuetaonis]USQ59356.1 hypothetical protein NF551_17390 [Arthrobacter caoxuetaonis]